MIVVHFWYFFSLCWYLWCSSIKKILKTLMLALRLRINYANHTWFYLHWFWNDCFFIFNFRCVSKLLQRWWKEIRRRNDKISKSHSWSMRVTFRYKLIIVERFRFFCGILFAGLPNKVVNLAAAVAVHTLVYKLHEFGSKIQFFNKYYLLANELFFRKFTLGISLCF